MVSASSLVPKLRFGNRGDSGTVVNGEQNDATNGDSEIDLESSLCTDFTNNATLQNVSHSHRPLMAAPPPPVTDVRHHNSNPPFHSPYAGPVGPRRPPGALPASLRRPLIPEPRMARLGMPLGHLDRTPVQPPVARSLILDTGVSRDVSVLGLQAPGMLPSSGQPGPWSPIGHPNMVPSQYVQHDVVGGSPSQTWPVRPLHQKCFHRLLMVFPRTSPTPTMTAPTAIGSDQFVSMSCMPFVGPDENIESSGLPHPTHNSTSVVMHETCQNILYSPVSVGNCSPSHMRCTMNQVPCTNDLLKASCMPLSLIIQPLALPHPSEEPVQVVDFGESGPVRCNLCKAYINPFMKFTNRGTHFICNLCGFVNETRHYCWNLGMDGMHNDADKRPELYNGTVEFVATKDYMIRDPVHGVYVFLIDISIDALNTGATAAACSAIKQVIGDLPEGPQTMVGLITYSRSIQFYKLKRTSKQPVMLIFSDTEDVFTPLPTDVIVNLSEWHQCLEEVLENIPSMFEGSNSFDSAFGAAVKAGCLLLETTGGKILVFQSVLPSIGVGALSVRQDECLTDSSREKASQKLLQPANNFLNSLAIELAKCQVRVDIFLTTQTYVDVASISVIPKITGGQMYYYYPFSAHLHSAKLYNDLKWNITRLQASEGVMCVRCSTGLQVEEYSGNFYKDRPNLFVDWRDQSSCIGFAGIDCDKTITVTLKHDDKLKGPECSFQCALVYTTIDGQRMIRVNTLSLPTTTALENMFHSADAETQLSCFSKKVANEITTSSPLQVRERLTDSCINILHSYHKSCATMSDPRSSVLPRTLSLLPLYILALSKSITLQSSGWVDDKSYWISRVSALPISLVVPLIYPRMMAIHHLLSQDADGSLNTPRLPLSSELVTEDGIFLLENGEDALIYVGDAVDPFLLQQLFGTSSIGGSTQLVLQQYDNPSSRKLNDLIYGIRCFRCSYLCLKFCRKGDLSEMLFKSFMIEDGIGNEPSSTEFIHYVFKEIRSKLSNGR